MEKTKTFEELVVWQKAHELTLNIYKYTKLFPREEIYGLTSQIRRAAVSVTSNIAEGYKKKSKAHKLNYLNIAEASLEEVKYQSLLSKDLKYLELSDYSQIKKLTEDVGRLLNGYYNAIQSTM